MADQGPVRVLFVCMGNICRSPTAHGIFAQMVEKAGLSQRIEVGSAGTTAFHVGEAPDPRSVAEAARRGVPLRSRARQLIAEDLDTFDWILAMDRDNLTRIRRLAAGRPTRARIELLREREAPGAHQDVPDPYAGGPAGFREVFDMCDHNCRLLLDQIRANLP
jgi:protein-tyrosine phosphatase